ncbi:hypothetical protein [Mycolicibacterium thermoresistibile]|uniref:Gp181 n=1 Tax=Mycolicibacterium thermoresistibile TaxID=1797 RepID=A0A100XAT6_MYCTH|nr:hypothetical protein [Mycolicibacterium thermoresistibile]MCV7187014.1 hypothetical protein [Mycolicibacterium thermoresistibile]GAT13189.1 Gp181 [Mycolicibacterium thermoresistibile]SNW20365.1 Uncharacterised protein [Mycolicibacterium thermoresistibile]
MRSYDEVIASARDEAPFSNGTEGYGWMENWCYRPCMNPVEVAWRRYENGERKTPPKDYPGGCPLIQAALLGKTPVEWIDQWGGTGPYPIADRFHCIEFRGPDGGSGEPRPRPDPPGMDGLFERPERAVRMLAQPHEAREAVPVP